MATFHDARKLAAHIRRRAAHLRRSADFVTRESAEVAAAEARKLSEGRKVSARDLRRAGHPYAKNRLRRLGDRRRGTSTGPSAAPSLFSSWPLTPLNQRSGRLARSWRVFRRAGGGADGETVYRLQNVSPESRFLLRRGGTKRMVDRQFWEALSRRTVPALRRKAREAQRAALRQG